MGKITYLTRRSGIYYVQIRMPAAAGRASKLWRFSLQTTDYRKARLALINHLTWLIPMQTAENDDDRIALLCEQLEAYRLRGPAQTQEDLDERLKFLARNKRFIDDATRGSVSGMRLSLYLAFQQFWNALDSGERNLRQSTPTATPTPHDPGLGVQPPQSPTGTPHQAGHLSHLPMSEVLKKFLTNQAKANGDDRAKADFAPIVEFAIALWGDPILTAVTGEQILLLMEEMTNIPGMKTFGQNERDLYSRYLVAKECNFRRKLEIKGQEVEVELDRVSVSTLKNRYKIGLDKFFEWAIKNKFYQGPQPDFDFSTPLNPGTTERDSFRHEEIVEFLSAPLFTGCQSQTRMWEEGNCFFQSYFYWAILISLLCGLRPGETGQFRCRDVLDLYGRPHFRFAKEEDTKAKRKGKGGKQGKTPNAFRWIPIHPLLLELGLLDRRDAILKAYVERETKAAKRQLSEVEIQAIKDVAEEQWLFPDWRVQILSTGVIKWSHAVSKAWQYVQEKFEISREGLAFYSARHTFKGFLDEVKELSDRSRRVISGHSTNVDVHGGYGPKMITEAQMEVALALDNKTIQAISEILLTAHKKAAAGELRIIDAWKVDVRSGDKRFQEALAKKSQQYR